MAISKKNQERNEFLENLINQIDDIPISEVIGRRVDLIQKGQNYVGLCPFHTDTKIGSFYVTDSKKIFKCFACGEGGHATTFVQKYDNLHYIEAVLRIGYEEGLISADEYDKYTNSNFDKNYVKEVQKKHELVKKEVKRNLPYEAMHNIYSFLKETWGLSDAHRKHLEQVRNLPSYRIEKDYFTIPKNTFNIVDKVLEKFPEYENILETVPGFYFNVMKNKIMFSAYEGIGIFIRDFKGNIVGVQIRKDNKKNQDEQRYVWLSTSWASYNPTTSRGGNSPGAPVDVTYPQAMHNIHAIAIVEGKFKSEVLAQNKMYGISVQGVGNFNGIEYTIDFLQKRDSKIKTAYIFYDADMLGNTAVFKQAMRLGDYLKEKCPNLNIKFAIWHEELGKGIDDLYFNSRTDDIKYVTKEKLWITSKIHMDSLIEEYELDESLFNKMPIETKKEFCAKLQHRMEMELFQ